ncbi:MAG: hypothetical protein IT437_03415 [Phycisphaerales bacterium]|nr:hypothetical protein [Phycisphaerales bacterium]
MSSGPKSDSSSNFLAEMRGGESGTETPMVLSAPGRKVNVQTLVVVGVVVASAGLLYAMRLHGMGAGMKFDSLVKIDYDWTKSGQLSESQQRAVLADLARSHTSVEPLVEHLPKNPFSLDLDAPASTAPIVSADPNADARRLALQRQVREKEILSQLAGLQLNSVMEGRVPLARIGTRMYRVGDKVGENFTLSAVHGRTVDLEADGKLYALSIEAPVAPENDGP